MRQNILLFPVKDCIIPLFFISTKPAIPEMVKPLAMAISKETQTSLEEVNDANEEYRDYTADAPNCCNAECGGFRKIFKKCVLLTVAVAVIVIVVYVVTVAWHGNIL